MTDYPISGTCDPAFTAVREAFQANFNERSEIGAAVAVMVNGRLVVDLWGGYRDLTNRPWEQDTIVDVFSVGKAMVATALLILIDQGRLHFDDLVARHWPEFAAGGKESVTVAQLMSHQAGLPGVRQILAPHSMYDWQLMTNALAQEVPWWSPGSAHGYHVNTLGFLGGELVRRVSGRPFGEFFDREVAGPLGADFQFGLSSVDQRRVADFQFPDPTNMSEPTDESDYSLIYGNPPGVSGIGTVNTPEWRRAVHPSTNGHSNARAVARIYSVLAAGGKVDHTQLLSPDVIIEARKELVSGLDRVLDRESRFGFGFQLTQEHRPLGPNPCGYGHFGAGGSIGMADPDANLAFAYVMNRFGQRWQDPRNKTLVAAAYSAL